MAAFWVATRIRRTASATSLSSTNLNERMHCTQPINPSIHQFIKRSYLVTNGEGSLLPSWWIDSRLTMPAGVAVAVGAMLLAPATLGTTAVMWMANVAQHMPKGRNMAVAVEEGRREGYSFARLTSDFRPWTCHASTNNISVCGGRGGGERTLSQKHATSKNILPAERRVHT